VDNRHIDPLRRIYQADKLWADDGHEPRSFMLLRTGGRVQIDHPCWSESWSVPSYETIDDLEELDILRVEPHAPNHTGRTFSLTMKGRDEARALVERSSTDAGGVAPSIDLTLRWLVNLRAVAPECFEPSLELLARAIGDGLITVTGREAFARQLLGLVSDGYLRGTVPDLDQPTAEQLISYTPSLEVTLEAYRYLAPIGAPSVTFNAPVVGSQVAAGDIFTYSFFIAMLDQAHAAVDDFDAYDEHAKTEARSLLDRLRGKATAVAGTVGTSTVTAAGTALTMEAIKKAFGI